jgi:hypothetical protein
VRDPTLRGEGPAAYYIATHLISAGEGRPCDGTQDKPVSTATDYGLECGIQNPRSPEHFCRHHDQNNHWIPIEWVRVTST